MVAGDPVLSCGKTVTWAIPAADPTTMRTNARCSSRAAGQARRSPRESDEEQVVRDVEDCQWRPVGRVRSRQLADRVPDVRVPGVEQAAEARRRDVDGDGRQAAR